jgi:hypothetical protein
MQQVGFGNLEKVVVLSFQVLVEMTDILITSCYILQSLNGERY